MKFLVLAFTLVAAANARPDVSHLGPSGSYLPGTGGLGLGTQSISTGIGFGNQLVGGHGINGFVGQGGYNGQGAFGNHGLISQDQKHVYFYAAPDDEQASRLRIHIAPSSHRNTKIIFVKAPSSGGVIPEVIAPPSQAEDKTLVYVLVKKQDHGGAITIPSSLGVKQAKPEVYFIKYRNQAEAEQAVAGGLSGQAVGSGLSDLGNEASFVRTLQVRGGGHGGHIGDGGFIGGGDGGIIGGGGGGSSILGTVVNGGTKYGVPGASGPYKR